MMGNLPRDINKMAKGSAPDAHILICLYLGQSLKIHMYLLFVYMLTLHIIQHRCAVFAT